MAKSAIPGAKRGDIFWVEPEEVTIIGLDTDHKAGEHHLWDKRIYDKIPESRIRNIQAIGVQVPVEVIKAGTTDEGKPILWVVDGRGRTRASRIAKQRAIDAGDYLPDGKLNVHQLPVVLVRNADDAKQVTIMVALNEHRTDDDVLTKARRAAYVASLERHNKHEIANMFGVDLQTITLWQNILNLAPQVLKAIERGKISAYSCRPLFKLSHDQQVEKLKELLAQGVKASEPNMRRVADGEKPRKPRALLPKPKVRKIVEDEKFFSSLNPQAQAILRVILGEEDAVAAIPGLAERLKAKPVQITIDKRSDGD